MRKLGFLLTLLSSAAAQAQIDWGGTIWGNHLRSTANFQDRPVQQNAGARLQVKTGLTENLNFTFEGLGYFVKTPLLFSPGKDLSKGELFLEANSLNLSATFGSWSVKAGQMTTAWGKSDGLNPTDFLSGRRSILFVTEDQLTRRGFGGVMLEWLPGEGSSPWALQQWIVPQAAHSDLLLSPQLISETIRLEDLPQTSELEIASKVSYSGQGWEFDYTYFRGVNKAPLFTEGSRNFLPFSLSLRPVQNTQQAHGINFVKDFEDWILRLESAYVSRIEIYEEADFITDPSRLDVVFGAEKVLFTDHRFNFQAVYHHYPTYEENLSSDLVVAQIQRLNRIVQGQHLQTRLGYLLVYSYEPPDLNQLKFRASWLNYVKAESSGLFTPEVSYGLNDHLNFKLYGMIFHGDEDTPYGAVKDLRSLALGAQLLF